VRHQGAHKASLHMRLARHAPYCGTVPWGGWWLAWPRVTHADICPAAPEHQSVEWV